MLTVIDDFNREGLVSTVLKRRSASAVVRILGELFASRKPAEIRTDNGGEFKGKIYREWMNRAGVGRIYARPHTPTDNRHIELFNRLLRHEVLHRFECENLTEVQSSIDDWLLHYNYVRPQQQFRGLSPLQYSALRELARTTRRDALQNPLRRNDN